MKKSLLLLFLITFHLNAQEYKLGKVAKDDLAMTVYTQDTTASALVLYKHRTTQIDHDAGSGWVIVTEIHKRIKILKKDGLDYATEKVNLYKTNKSQERISGLKGYTHNLEGNKVNSEKLKKSSIFNTDESDNWKSVSFTMPNAKVGSIVEWTYKITSPFFKIDDVVIQEDIPTQHFHAKIDLLSYFNFQRIVKGGYSITPKEYSEPRSLSYSYEQDTNLALTQATKFANLQTTEYVSEYELRHVPALKEEKYVDNIDNYRFLITYELMSVEFPNSGLREFSTTWDKVVKTIYEDDDFGDQLKKKNYFKDDLETVKANSADQNELINNIYSFVRDKMTWNKKSRSYTQSGVQRAYKENTGNSAEINLILVAMLKEAGINANPVLVSTRSHGIPVFPTLEGFNYVVACVEFNGKEILMDATEKLSTPGLLPERALNWEGTLMYDEKNHKKVNLYPKELSQHNTILNVIINEDGSIQGDQNSSFSKLEALEYRNNLTNVNEDSYAEAILNEYQLDDISDLNIQNIDALDQPIRESFNFEIDEGVTMVGDEIYFSPIFFYSYSENPFKLEERQYPVNFNNPFNRKKIVNVKIPEGFQVVSLPEPIRMKMPEGLGSFTFNIAKTENGLSVMSNFKINSPIIPPHIYHALKEFYNQRVKKETEKVVLKRI